MTLIESLVYTVILIVGFLFLLWKKEESESYYPLKIIGYLILGSFAFIFNHISLPFGFVVYLLFFRPKLNVWSKRVAAVIGVCSFVLVHWILPSTIHQWQSRPINLQHEVGSAYSTNFQEEYQLIRKKLKLEKNRVALDKFELDYYENGKIKDLRWELIAQTNGHYTYCQIHYEVGQKKYLIMRSQSDNGFSYSRSVPANLFFKNLDVLNLKSITQAKGPFAYYVVKSYGERTSYDDQTQKNYLIQANSVHLLDNKKLPIEAYFISTLAMKKTGEKKDKKGNIVEQSFEGTKMSNYLFAVNSNNPG